jgi:hypothetical protein
VDSLATDSRESWPLLNARTGAAVLYLRSFDGVSATPASHRKETLLPSAALLEELPLPAEAAVTVARTRPPPVPWPWSPRPGTRTATSCCAAAQDRSGLGCMIDAGPVGASFPAGEIQGAWEL